MAPCIQMTEQELSSFCKRWRIVELALFGSVLRDDFGPESDIDVLVTFHPEAAHGFIAFMTIQEELGQLLGREVDLHGRAGVERSRNYIRRRAILDSAEVIYAAR